MDRFFRGITNRLRGTPEVTPDASVTDRDIPDATTQQIPVYEVDPEVLEDVDTDASDIVMNDTEPEDEPEASDEHEDDTEGSDDDQDDDSDSEDTAPDDDDGSLLISAGDDDGTITSGSGGDSDGTFTFESDDVDTVTVEDGGDNSFVIGTGDDGSTIVWSDGSDSNTIEDAGNEDEEEPVAGVDVEVYPEPEPEPDPEPQPESSDDQEPDTVRTIDLGDLDLTGRDFSDFRRGESSDTDSADQPRIADLSPQDLRVQPEIATNVNLADYLNTDDDEDEDDDDEDQIPVSKDELIEKPVIEHQPAPGTGLPIPLPNSAEGLDVMAGGSDTSPAAEQPAELVEALGSEILLSSEQPQKAAPEALQMAGDSEAGEPSKTVDMQDIGTKLGGDEIAWVGKPESRVEQPANVSLNFEEIKVDAVDNAAPVEPKANLLEEKPRLQDEQAIGTLDFKSTSGMDDEQTSASLTTAEVQPAVQIEMPDVEQKATLIEASVETVPVVEEPFSQIAPLDDSPTPEDDDDPLDGI